MRTGMTHTPGPWQVDSGMVQAVAKDSRGLNIPIAYMDREAGNGTMPVERDANAHLIAAAPELLDLCKFAAGFVARHKQKDDGMNLHADLLAAIAKAEGRQ